MTGAERLAGTSPIRSRVQPTSIVWANRIFATRADLARWLRSRGASYDTWALQHPAVAAASGSSPQAESANAHSGSVQSKSQDPRHLVAVGVAVGVAIVLALILLYQRRTYDFRGRLQRSPPALALGGARAATTGEASAGLGVARDVALSLRAHIVHPATAKAKAIAQGAGPTVVAPARSGAPG